MDLYCSKCGEPVENDELHDYAASLRMPYADVAQDFRSNGCSAVGMTCSSPSTSVDPTFGLTRQEASGALYDLLGDDMDGTAAMMEDLGW